MHGAGLAAGADLGRLVGGHGPLQRGALAKPLGWDGSWKLMMDFFWLRGYSV